MKKKFHTRQALLIKNIITMSTCCDKSFQFSSHVKCNFYTCKLMSIISLIFYTFGNYFHTCGQLNYSMYDIH